MSKLITVILVTYNDRYLYDCLDSLNNQTYKDFKLILINDGGKDLAIFNRYIKMEIDYIHLKNNIGLTKCLNIGISKANTKYIARMDSDDYALPERFELQIEYLKKYKLDLIGSSIIRLYKNNKNKFLISNNNIIDIEEIKNVMRYKSPIAHPTFFGKTKLFKKLMYNEKLLYSQDYDLLARSICNNYKVGILNEPILIYNNNPSNNYEKIINQMNASNFISKRYTNFILRKISYKKINYEKVNLNNYQRICLSIRSYSLKMNNNIIKNTCFFIYLILSMKSNIMRDFNFRNLVYKFKKNNL